MKYIIEIDVKKYDPETGAAEGTWSGQKNSTEEARDAVSWKPHIYSESGGEPVDDCSHGIFTAYKR